jgi:hypothetical protein
MSTAVGFLAIVVVLSIVGGMALMYFTNRGRRLPDVLHKRPPRMTRSTSPALAKREPRSGVRVLGVDEDPKKG